MFDGVFPVLERTSVTSCCLISRLGFLFHPPLIFTYLCPLTDKLTPWHSLLAIRKTFCEPTVCLPTVHTMICGGKDPSHPSVPRLCLPLISFLLGGRKQADVNSLFKVLANSQYYSHTQYSYESTLRATDGGHHLKFET